MRNLTFKAAMLNDSRTTVNRQSTDGQSQRHCKQTPLSKRWKVLMTLVFLFTFAIGQMWAADITVTPPTPNNASNPFSTGLYVMSVSGTGSKLSSGAITTGTKGAVITINFQATKSDMYIKTITFNSLGNGTLSSDDGTFDGQLFTATGNKNSVNVVLTSGSGQKGTVKVTNVVVNTGTNVVETITFTGVDSGDGQKATFTSSAATSALSSITTDASAFSVSSGKLSWANGKKVILTAESNIKYVAFSIADGKMYDSFSAAETTYNSANYSWSGSSKTVTLTNGSGGGREIKGLYVIIDPVVKHHVTYSLGGDYGTTPTQADVAEGGKFTLHNGTTGITAPENKTFAGWSDGTTTYEGGAEYTMGDDDVTLTAQWATSYDISYDKGAYGTGEIAGGKKAENVAYTLSSSMFTRENYLQVGWATADGASRSYMIGGSYTTNAAQTFYPAWAEKDTYVAAFHYDSENPTTPPAGWTFANAGTYTNTSATVAYVGKFTAEGETTASGKSMDPNHIAFAKNADADAVYDLGYVTTVSAVAGTLMIGSTSAKVASIDYLAADGSTVLHSFNITHNKADWGANNFNETEVVPNVRYIRINGKDFWQVLGAFSVTYGSLVPKYDLTFAKNGGSGDDMATLRYAEDALVTLPGCTFTAPTNKTFDAWVVTKTASGNPITITDGKFTMPAEAVTATATWKFLPKLTLTAGEGATGDDEVAYYAAGTQISVPEKPAGFSNGTKDFTGWVYSQETEVTAGKFAMPATDLTLTAQWASATAVAQILGGDSYETFAEAIAAVAAGKTIQLLADCSYDAAWNLTLAGTVTLDLNGHDLTYNGSGRGVQVHNGAKLILEDGTATVAPTIDLTADPLSRSAITYTSGTFDSKDGMCATAGGEIEINSGTYLATEGVVLVVGNAATVTVNDGVLISRDNGVLMGNGTNSDSYRNYVINVHGGILLGEIFSAGYASMVIYHPNVGELNIDGGTLVSTNGPAVVCRGGESNITGGTIVAQGSGSGKCGDASLVLPAVGVAYDFKSAYPGVSSFDAKISGDANVSGEAGAVKGIYADTTPTTAEKDAVAISGGTFNSPVAEALCAENYAPNSWTDGTGTHYGVKPLAVTFDIEAYVVGDNTVDLDDVKEQLTAKGYAYSNISGVDRGHTHNYIYDGIKWSNANDGYIQFETAAKKLVIVKTGRMQSDASAKMSVNGVESATVIESADESKETHKLYYWYNADAALYKLDIKSKTAGGTCVLKAITITDPYEVSYNTHGGDPIAAQYFYGTAITLPTPTYGTQSFKGWYDAETGGNLIGAAGASYTPTGNIELHAQWETVSTVNTLSDLQVDGATIDGFDPATDIYYLVYEYGQQPVITSATATAGALATVTINNTPVDEGTYKYVQVKVVPESGEEDQKFYQVRYTNKLKRGVEIIKVETTGGNNKTVSGLYAGDGDVNLSTGGNARKMDEGKYIGFILDGTALEAGDIVNVHTSAAATTGGSHIIFYDNMTDKTELYETGEIGGTGDNLFVINAAMEGSTTAYVYRSNADNAHKWNGFVDYLSAERYMAPFIESFKIGEAIGTIDKVNKTIAVEVPATADLEHLTPTIKAYANGGATLDKTGEQDFSAGAVNYTVSSAYAEDGDVTYAVTVTKAAAIKEVIISGTLSVLEGETTTLSAAVYDTNDELASIQAVVWTVKSGDESLAEVSATGVVTGKAVGTAHIIATSVADDTKSAEVEVAISENPCRVWNAPTTSWSDAMVTIGYSQIKRGECPASSSVTPYSGASSVYGIKVDGSAKFIELTMSDGSQFESLTLGVASGSNGSSPKYALVASSAVTFNTSSVLSVAEYTANAKDAAQALNDIVLPGGTRNVRIYRMYEGKGEGTSVYLYYANACKKELVPLTSVSVADMSLAVGVAGTPVVTLNPTTADVASYAWSIESDETGVATIDPATGVLSSAATGAVTVKVTATDAFSNVRESNVATINIVNKYVDVVPVSETTTWSWSGKATSNISIVDVDTVLANYLSGTEWQKIAGKAGEYAYRAEGHDCYQGTYLYLKATVPGMLIINTRYASSGAKLSVNGHEIATLTDQYTEYKVAVPAGNVKIEATGNQKMRIKTMTFDADLASYDVTKNKYNGYTRDVTEGRYGTICLPNGGIMVGATLYEVAYYGATSEKIFFDEILNGTMVAGVPYIYLPNEGADKLAVFYTDEANESAKSANGLVGYIGASENTSDALPVPHNDGNYILNNNQYREVVSANSAYILSHRAYIHLAGITPSEPALAPGRRRISMSVYSEQVATGIENTGFESEAPRKVLINGELFIIRGEKMYDAKGQLVK